MNETTIPAGWYADPSGVRGQRWWDGLRWTGHVQPPPFEMSLARPVPAAGSTWGFTGSNGPAFFAMILGLVALIANPLLLASAGALICGIAGLRQSGGRAMAWSGIGLSGVGLLSLY
ncbi:DUF2510 domain-containing protein [Actinoplanes sp. NPDC051861]|uniref:DUF2510 domain-containing protein n=1 Tax=Actinoplanes sp. NPDC051861 TaxID=3155170 RepID=UPI003449FD04